jgi:hypothetical protein
MNLHLKRPRMSKHEGIGSLITSNFQSHKYKYADEETAHNEVHMYTFNYLLHLNKHFEAVVLALLIK